MIAASLWNPAFVLNALARAQTYDVVADVAYTDGERGKLDIYKPRDAHDAPVIVFFYGGSWQTGAKESYLFLATTLAARGYVVIVPDYRVYPAVRFPEFLNDGAKVVRWARDNAAVNGGDASRVFLMGHSAGAYIAAMLAIDGEWLKGVGLAPERDIAGLIGVSGPYDFLPLHDETLKVIFDGNRPETQPITFAQGKKPPALLMTGADDNTVQPGNSQRLADKLRSQGNDAASIIYRRLGHITILLGLAPYVSNYLPLLNDIDVFIGRIKSAGLRPATGASAR